MLWFTAGKGDIQGEAANPNPGNSIPNQVNLETGWSGFSGRAAETQGRHPKSQEKPKPPVAVNNTVQISCFESPPFLSMFSYWGACTRMFKYETYVHIHKLKH